MEKCLCIEKNTSCMDLVGKGCRLAYGQWCMYINDKKNAECLDKGYCSRNRSCAD